LNVAKAPRLLTLSIIRKISSRLQPCA